MDINNEYYKKIIYKKNIEKDLKEIFLKNYRYKKILCVYSSSARQDFGVKIGNAMSLAGCAFNVVSYSSAGMKKEEIYDDLLLLKYKNFDLIVCVGGGTICDASKMISNVFGCELILVTATPSNFSYFTDFALGFNGEIVFCDRVKNILIDEECLSKASEDLFKNGMLFLKSLFVAIEEIDVNKEIFKEELRDCPITKSRLFEMIEEIDHTSDHGERNLLLMDAFIEIGYCFNGISKNYLSVVMLAEILRLNSPAKTCFGELAYVGAVSLHNCYEKFFSLKTIKMFLTEENIIKNNLNINGQKHVKNDKYSIFYRNNLFFNKINAIKNNLLKNILEENTCLQDKFSGLGLTAKDCVGGIKILANDYDCGLLVDLIHNCGVI
ncbi:MAG: iron-containing alcohol dehydrogenase [Clostridia bacterium]